MIEGTPDIENLTLIENPGGLNEVVLEGDVWHACPFADESDYGSYKLILEPRPWLPELHSLDEYMTHGWEDVKISHEGLTQRLAADLSYRLECSVDLTTEFRTGDIKCRTSSSVRIIVGCEPSYAPEDDPRRGLPLK